MPDFDSLTQDNQQPQAAPTPAPDQSKPQMFDDLKETTHPTAFDKLPDDNEKYSTPLQQAGTIAEGLAQGIAGPLATGAELGLSKLGVPGLSAEEQAGRRATNPVEFQGAQAAGLIGGLLTGTGEASLIAKGVGAIPKIGQVAADAGALTKVGSAAIKGAMEMGLIQGGDEISKAMLGQGDPEHPVSAALSNMGASALLGATSGGVLNAGGQAASKGLQHLQETKAGTRALSFLAGLGHAATFPMEAGVPSEKAAMAAMSSIPQDVGAAGNMANTFNPSSFKAGQKAYNSLISGGTGTAMKYGSRAAAGLIGQKLGGAGGAVISIPIEQALEKAVNYTIPKVSQKYVGPALLKMAASGSLNNLGQAVNYASSIAKGNQAIGKGVDSLFKVGGKEALDFYHSDTQREKLRDFIENGGVDQQIREESNAQSVPQYAEGGQVKPMAELSQPNAIAHHWPEQNVLLNAAKARVSNYLNSVRPVKNPNKLPFDSEHKDHQKDREYDKVLDLANQPLSILKHVKNGTLLPKHMKDFSSMYPELHQHLSKRMTEQIAQNHMDEEKKPPYHVRQALSLFLGSSLDSTLTPAGIQAAQGVFIKQKAQNQAPPSKASLSKMGTNDMTPEQARTKRLNKS